MSIRREEPCEGCGLLTKKTGLYLDPKQEHWLCLRCQPSPTGPHAATPADEVWGARALTKEKK